MSAYEWQFDGLVGPTHNYSGLSYGNVASTKNANNPSNPRLAALQGLEKMWFVTSLGINQAFFPPQPRPVLSVLRSLGFSGNDIHMLETAAKQAPDLLASVYSSAFMWAANAATIAPSSDCADGKLHFTPANLISNFHRKIESSFTYKTLRKIFGNERFFTVHEPLPDATRFSDEGAANHMRVAGAHGSEGLHVYVYGISEDSSIRPEKFPARQNRQAFEAIARQQTVKHALHIQQHPHVIDQGVFHNDVIAMNTTRLMIAHEKAFVTPLKQQIRLPDFQYVEITDDMLTVPECVATYFFNSQLLELPSGEMVIVAPKECEEHARAHAVFAALESGNKLISNVHYIDVRESMRNGGGPACLRLRVVMTEEESQAMHQGIILTEERYKMLRQWVQQFYRDRLSFDDLRDPKLITEVEDALTALSRIIEMPDLYV
ncbi:MAG: N-succinylarginine dihydrolase [Alphaproteobacteria bacterium]|nr:N-succinylarginine dihydrolase [Alphaproteobacteria bacterium]